MRSATRAGGLPLAAVSAVEALAQHRLLDRAIRGRTWIGIVAFALIGIVALQLGLLKLNGGIGRALEREALLQRQNAALSIENSEMAAGPKVEALAAKRGMAFASTSQLRFLGASPAEDVAKAAAALTSAARAATARASESSGSASGESSTAAASTSESESSSSSSASGEASSETAEASGEASSAQPSESASGEASSTSGSSSEAGSSSARAEAPAAGAEAPAVVGGEAEPSGGTQPTAGG